MRPALFALALAFAPVGALAQDEVPEGTTPSAFETLRAMEDDLLDAVRTRNPDAYAQLQRLKQVDRRAYWRMLGEIARRHQARRPNPEEKVLLDRLEALRARYPQGVADLSAAEQRVVRKDLTEIATRLFDVRQSERRARLDSLREALTELEQDVAERDATRDARIKAFVERAMLGPVDL